jgi:hypothetical protein
MHVRTFRFAAALVVAAGFCAATARGDAVVYRQPPKAIEDGLRAPVLPDVLVSPTRDSLAIDGLPSAFNNLLKIQRPRS